MADELPEVERIVEASIAGTHAFQVRVHLESGEGDAACFASGGLSEDELAGLVSAHEALAAGDESAAEMLLAAGLALDERLPVSVVTAVLSKRCPDAEPGIIRAWANVVQTALEVERDGEIVQDLLGLYAKLGILATADEIGLDDEDAFFLVLGREMSDASCAAPFGTSPGEFQIALRKAANWAVKFRGIEGPADYAEEISRWPDVAACLGAIREMRPARIHIVGHSFSMSAHWAAQASFTDTALELMMRENSGIERRWLGEGGMRATRAREAYFDDAVAWGPDIVIFVVALFLPFPISRQE